MSEIKAVLLVPAEDDPHGLLREGPCGARPPMAYLYKRAWAPCTARGAHSFDKRRALVLAWGGQTVVEGMDRLDWCRHRGWGRPGRGQSANYVPAHDDVPDTLWRAYENGWLAAHGGDHKGIPGIGTLVLLDAEGREVSDG